MRVSYPLWPLRGERRRERDSDGNSDIREESAAGGGQRARGRRRVLARAFNVSLLVAKEEHLLPQVHRPARGEGWLAKGGVRARVVERQIVRHLTHLIPYLTPSP